MAGGATRNGSKSARSEQAISSSNEAVRERERRGSPDTQYYLMKSEPDDFSVDDLALEGQSSWDGVNSRRRLLMIGVRNYQARNVMKSMSLGDKVFFYHSSCKVPGITGVAEVVNESYPDESAFDPNTKYHDPKSTPDTPKWFMVDIRLVRKLRRCIPLSELKQYKDGPLQNMVLLNRGRLSVQPVTCSQWEFIIALENGIDGDMETAKDRSVSVTQGRP
eukprot:CAMPEP_0177791226 /NCGR_PEP_ID=MMETSP0491_2-20121128/23811_1 /TAXON_ID=63592 /ORGANISM="Tetraselmis chuii, Strain PLY429" /LENGTH=219 /DNA_ID=CAMNT_0019313425 /DNA_START=184 /DNA_END=844 /DNA_ORIENTATION=-